MQTQCSNLTDRPIKLVFNVFLNNASLMKSLFIVINVMYLI